MMTTKNEDKKWKPARKEERKLFKRGEKEKGGAVGEDGGLGGKRDQNDDSEQRK